MLDTRLYLLQRISALIMAPLVLLHLGVMIVAIQGGLDSALFVITVSIHAAIGLRVVMFEWLSIQGIRLNLVSWLIFTALLMMGARAVYAVVA
jgi:fumarate reductase subunit C